MKVVQQFVAGKAKRPGRSPWDDRTFRTYLDPNVVLHRPCRDALLLSMFTQHFVLGFFHGVPVGT
jgi:hypothetical protein